MLHEQLRKVEGKLIVSCQASPGDAFYGPGRMALFVRAALDGGAAGLRLNGPADIRDARAITHAPIIGIHKEQVADGRILITPSFERAAELVQAGADGVAIDCTSRGRRYGALERVTRVRCELRVPVMADIATVEEALAARDAGAEFVLPTMRGYTDDTGDIHAFDTQFVRELVRTVNVPVFAEGRIGTPEDARRALDAGAFAVVVGSAITRPQEITRGFVRAMERGGSYCAMDIGGTAIKWGVVGPAGELLTCGSVATPRGSDALLSAVRAAARSCVAEAGRLEAAPRGFGVATAGWVDRARGSVLFSTGTIAGWDGAEIRRTVEEASHLPCSVENDAVAAAAGEWIFGAARGCDHFVTVTIGTGIGGGAVVEGRLLRGAHGLANMLGHIVIERSGNPCTCGQAGCLEAYAGAMGRGADLAVRLARGLAPAVQLLDPEFVFLSGGVAAGMPDLAAQVEDALAGEILASHLRRVRVRNSAFPAAAGLLGAAALARLGAF